LIDERAQVLVEAGIDAVQRLQHRDRRLLGRRGDAPPGKAKRSHGTADQIGPGEKQHEGEAEIAHEALITRIARTLGWCFMIAFAITIADDAALGGTIASPSSSSELPDPSVRMTASSRGA